MSLGRVDRYELLALIGEGSFGGVYRARHIHTGQVHALKLARDAVDPEGAARMLAEARAAASLRHPHVVGIIDGGIAATGEAFIVMELLEGSTLSQLIKKEGPLPPARATRIARQMLDGLAAAHANGIVHRDVKPSNVFVTMASDVTGGDMVKVIDFGISKMRMTAGAAGNLTLPGVAMGTPGYMAPEQLGDARSVDPRADVYAVGATLFEMLTMRPPIEADSFETWMRRLRTEPAPLLATVAPHVPPALAAVVDRALARDPDARWPSAAAMRDALDLDVRGPRRKGSRPTALDTPRGVRSGDVPVRRRSGRHLRPAPLHANAPPYASSPPTRARRRRCCRHSDAPPHPAYSQHRRRSYATGEELGGSIVPWLVGALVVAIVLVGVVGAGAVFYVTRTSAETRHGAARGADHGRRRRRQPLPCARCAARGDGPGARPRRRAVTRRDPREARRRSRGPRPARPRLPRRLPRSPAAYASRHRASSGTSGRTRS